MKINDIYRQEFNIAAYSSLESLADIEFEDNDLSKIEVEDLKGIPYRLSYKTSVPCTLEEALEGIEGLDAVFDWVDYVKNNPRSEEATIVYIDNYWDWDSALFEDSYYGYFNSEEDFAEEYLDSIRWETDLFDFFDYERYGETLWEDLELDNYTPRALEDYREELGLPLDYYGSDDLSNKSRSKKEIERLYGFIGDDEEGEEGVLDDSFEEYEGLAEAREEYDRFIGDHSWEIRLAEYNYTELAEEYIDERWGGMEAFARNNRSDLEDFTNLESFANYLLSYDYDYINGYVFRKY